MNSVSAFAPANISCFFKIYKAKDPRWMGSFGVGFTLEEGITVKASKAAKTEILFNKKKTALPTVESLIKSLTNENVKVEISSNLPLGVGFGLSGAAALATAYALNTLLSLKKTKDDLAITAHIAETENQTGLGDIVSQYYGGFLLKRKPSSFLLAHKLLVNEKYVYCKVVSPLLTQSILSDKSYEQLINRAGDSAMKKIENLLKIKKTLLFSEIITIGKEFVIKSDLPLNKEVVKIINSIEKNGGTASMIVFGNSVYSDTPFKGAMKLKLGTKGASLL